MNGKIGIKGIPLSRPSQWSLLPSFESNQGQTAVESSHRVLIARQSGLRRTIMCAERSHLGINPARELESGGVPSGESGGGLQGWTGSANGAGVGGTWDEKTAAGREGQGTMETGGLVSVVRERIWVG